METKIEKVPAKVSFGKFIKCSGETAPFRSLNTGGSKEVIQLNGLDQAGCGRNF